jgi:hypothetical protein
MIAENIAHQAVLAGITSSSPRPPSSYSISSARSRPAASLVLTASGAALVGKHEFGTGGLVNVVSKVRAMIQQFRGKVGARRQQLAAERQREAIRLKGQGWNFVRIGEHLGITPKAAWEAWRRAMDAMLQENQEAAGRLFQLEYERLEAERAKTFDDEAALRAHLEKLEPHVRSELQVEGRNGEARTEKRVNARVAAEYRETLNALIRLTEVRIKLSERLSRLCAFDRAKATPESAEMEAFAVEMIKVSTEVREELEAEAKRAALPVQSSPTDMLTFEGDGPNGGPPSLVPTGPA